MDGTSGPSHPQDPHSRGRLLRVSAIRGSLKSRPRLWAALCLVLLCALLTTGGLNSGDGGSELTEAVHICSTGKLAASEPLGEGFRNFTGAHTWYDANDPGAMALMLPAACLGAVQGGGDEVGQHDLPSVAKGGASMTYALIGGLAVVFVFLTLSELTSLRRSWWWSLGFLFATGFLAYTKATWSVLPAATAVAAVAWLAVRSSKGLDGPRRTVYLTALAVGVGGLSRYSLLPFLAVGAVAAVLPAIRRLSRRDLLIAAAILLALMLPDFAYNAVRTGEFWKPAQTAQNHELTFDYLIGTPGLFFGIQHGLLFFAPFCLLGYAGAAWGALRSQGEARWRWLLGLGATVAYAVVVVLVQDWDKFGWGPRYLVPLLPALFIVAVLLAERAPRLRPLAYLTIGIGLLTQIPLALANWNAVAAVVGKDSRAPDQIVGLWNSALDGIAHGVGFGKAADQRVLQVPDTWWWHAVAHHAPHGIGLVLVAAVVAGLVLAGSWLCSRGADPDRVPAEVAPAAG